ncbi:hypothetical protein CBL_21243, partial [Carabus blaptoides fortunei]
NVEIDRVLTKKDRTKEFWNKKMEKAKKSKEQQQSKKVDNCGRCGKGPHSFKECPAANADCRKCNKKGDYAQCCRTVSTVNKVDTYIGTVNMNFKTVRNERWSAIVYIRKVKLSCKVDTGAEITCISAKIYDKFFAEVKLRNSERRLLNAREREMETRGYFWEKISYRGKSAQTQVYVVKDLKRMLLDGQTSEKLGLIKRIATVATVGEK